MNPTERAIHLVKAQSLRDFAAKLAERDITEITTGELIAEAESIEQALIG